MAAGEWRLSDAAIAGIALLIALLALGTGIEVVLSAFIILTACGLIALLHHSRRSSRERLLTQSLAAELDGPPDWDALLGLVREHRKEVSRLGSFRSAAEETLEHLREGVLRFSPGEGVTHANSAARSIFRLDEGSTVRLAANPSMARIEELIRTALSSGEVQGGELELSFPEFRSLVVKAVPSGEREWAVVIVDDVTEERRVQATRRDFVASAAHELRTPAAAILGLAETLSDMGDEDPEAAGRFRVLLRKEAKRLSRLVGDLLDLSRLERPDAAAVFGPVHVGEVLASVWEPLENLAQESGVRLE